MGVTPGPCSVAVEQLAAVIAAQADAFDLEEILQLEGIPADIWVEAKQQWLPKLAVDETLRAQYDESLIETQKRLTRAVTPIENDVSAWVTFLAECEAHSSDIVTAQHGLTPNDLARLQRKWQARFASDDNLATQAKKLRDNHSPGELTITVQPRALVPSPYAPASPPPPSEPTADADTTAVPPLSLETLAAILIEFSLGVELSSTYASHGFVSAAVAQSALLAWQQQLDDDPDAQDALQDIVDRQRNQSAVAATTAPAALAPPPQRSPWQGESADMPIASSAPIRTQLDTTAAATPAPQLPPLPFDSTGAFQPLALTDAEIATARRAQHVGDTAMATPVITDSLPFDGAVTAITTPPSHVAVPPAATVHQTALATPALQLDDPLPFTTSQSPAAAPSPTTVPSPLDQTTGMDQQMLAIEALPFDTDNSAQHVPSTNLDATGFIDSTLMHLDEMPFDDASSPIAAARPASKMANTPLKPHQAVPGKVSPAIQQITMTRAIEALSQSQLTPIPLPFATTTSLGVEAVTDAVSHGSNTGDARSGSATVAVAGRIVTRTAVPARNAAGNSRRRAKAITFVGQLPTLTVDQYACYIAERTLYPNHLAQVRTRYGVISEDGHGVMALRWAARLAAHPRQRQRYAEAYQQYIDWLHSHTLN